MDAVHIRMTNAEYMTMPDDGKRYELHDGELAEMPSAGMLHNWIVLILSSTLGALVLEHNLGYAAGDGLDYVLDEGLILKPDFSFIANVFPPFVGYPTRSPDLAVEVVSPSNSPMEMTYKMRMYIKYGSRLVWIIWPEAREVLIYRPSEDGTITLRTLERDDVLTGEDVVPGFSLSLRRLFRY